MNDGHGWLLAQAAQGAKRKKSLASTRRSALLDEYRDHDPIPAVRQRNDADVVHGPADRAGLVRDLGARRQSTLETRGARAAALQMDASSAVLAALSGLTGEDVCEQLGHGLRRRGVSVVAEGKTYSYR